MHLGTPQLTDRDMVCVVAVNGLSKFKSGISAPMTSIRYVQVYRMNSHEPDDLNKKHTALAEAPTAQDELAQISMEH